MTKRAYLTPRETRDMMDAQSRRCAGCMAPIGVWFGKPKIPFIAEHTFPVALGNDQKPDCLLCRCCADRKTNGSPATSYGSDKHAIAKCRRIRKKLAGTQRKGRPLQSRPFDKSLRKRMDGTVERRT
jgi:hypothetical protein